MVNFDFPFRSFCGNIPLADTFPLVAFQLQSTINGIAILLDRTCKLVHARATASGRISPGRTSARSIYWSTKFYPVWVNRKDAEIANSFLPSSTTIVKLGTDLEIQTLPPLEVEADSETQPSPSNSGLR